MRDYVDVRKPRINQITPGHEKYEIRTCEEHTCVRARRGRVFVGSTLFYYWSFVCANFVRSSTNAAPSLRVQSGEIVGRNQKWCEAQCRLTCGRYFLMFRFRVTKSAGVEMWWWLIFDIVVGCWLEFDGFLFGCVRFVFEWSFSYCFSLESIF